MTRYAISHGLAWFHEFGVLWCLLHISVLNYTWHNVNTYWWDYVFCQSIYKADQPTPAPTPHPLPSFLLSHSLKSWWRLYTRISPWHCETGGKEVAALGADTSPFINRASNIWLQLGVRFVLVLSVSWEASNNTVRYSSRSVFPNHVVQPKSPLTEGVNIHPQVVRKRQTISCLSVCLADLGAQTTTLILCSIRSTSQFMFYFKWCVLACCLRSSFVIGQINQQLNYTN